MIKSCPTLWDHCVAAKEVMYPQGDTQGWRKKTKLQRLGFILLEIVIEVSAWEVVGCREMQLR